MLTVPSTLADIQPAHVDIPRIREGQLGGFFWSVFTECHDDGADFLTPNNHVRGELSSGLQKLMSDTLEQIDVSRNLMAKYHDTFQFVTTAAGAERAIKNGKVASFMGIEGAHQLGNSLAGMLRLLRYS